MYEEKKRNTKLNEARHGAEGNRMIGSREGRRNELADDNKVDNNIFLENKHFNIIWIYFIVPL